MAQPFTLTFQLEGEGDVTISGEFTDEEQERLVSYLEQHEALVRSKPLREGMPCQLSFMWDQASGLTAKTTLPDEDTLGILLHLLRPFVLTNEPASFDRVSGIIGRRVESDHIRRFIREQRERYDGREFQQMVKISVNEGVLNSEQMLQDWLNTHQYHRDPAKRPAIAELLSWLPGESGKAIFVSMLINKVNAIHNLACLVAVVTGRTPQLQFQLHQREPGQA